METHNCPVCHKAGVARDNTLCEDCFANSNSTEAQKQAQDTLAEWKAWIASHEDLLLEAKGRHICFAEGVVGGILQATGNPFAELTAGKELSLTFEAGIYFGLFLALAKGYGKPIPLAPKAFLDAFGEK